MWPAPRQATLAEGGYVSGCSDGVTRILDISRSYFAPEAADATRQQVVRLMNRRGSDQSVGDYIVEYALLRMTAESKLEMGAGFPGQRVSTLRVINAGLRRREKSLVMASCRESLKFEDASAGARRLSDRAGEVGGRMLFLRKALRHS